MTEGLKIAAVILAAGRGSRMNSSVRKQFMQLLDKPVFVYSVKMFDRFADRIIVVTDEGSIEYCREVLKAEAIKAELVIISGGSERYISAMKGFECTEGFDIVSVHDAARACIDYDTVKNSIASAIEHGTGIAAVKVKDTIKISVNNNIVESTPDRNTLYTVQTPQSFRRGILALAYQKLDEALRNNEEHPVITDDAMVVEEYTNDRVYLSEGSYNNIKITTPEDIAISESILNKIKN